MDPTEAFESRAAGHRDAASRMLPIVYDQLRAIAGRYMRHERANHSLRPTELVHEAYLRLIDATRISWQGKTHFLAVSATQMRRILVEYARARGAQKRGGGVRQLTLVESIAPSEELPLDVLALDQALNKLASLSDRQCRIVELRFFGGLTVRETAHFLGVSEKTVKVNWQMARAWLLRELAG